MSELTRRQAVKLLASGAAAACGVPVAKSKKTVYFVAYSRQQSTTDGWTFTAGRGWRQTVKKTERS